MTGSGSGRTPGWAVVNSASAIAFTAFENLIGGSSADTFDFNGTGSITGSLDGGGGANVRFSIEVFEPGP